MSGIPPTAGVRGPAAAAAGLAARALGTQAAQAAGKSVAGAPGAAGAAKPAPKSAPPAPPVVFPPAELKERCEALLARYPTKMAALLPVLHIAQRHFGGWVSPEVEAAVAGYLGLPDAHVRGVLTFYAMFHTQPVGRHEVWVCRTLTCWLLGAERLTEAACSKAGIAKVGGTDAAGRFTVREMECLGLCEAAPAAFVDGEPLVKVTPESLVKRMEGCP